MRWARSWRKIVSVVGVTASPFIASRFIFISQKQKTRLAKANRVIVSL